MIEPRVYVLEDDGELRSLLRRGLTEEGFAVETTSTAGELLDRLVDEEADALVVDIGLPDADGRDVVQALRARGVGTPVLFLTARDALPDRLAGFAAGGDDYLTKPFAFAELVARVQALSRRARPALPPVLERDGVVLDLPRHQAARDGRFLLLSPKEFAVLEVLMRAEGAVVSAEDLLEKAWDEHADPFTNAVRVAVMTLRRKLGDPPVIETVPGAGYRFGTP